MAADRSILDIPPGTARAHFPEGFGPRFLLTVDTEEEFDWAAPFSRTGHRLDHVARLAKFQQFCEGLGVAPVYLVDWPVASSPAARDILAPAVAAGRAEIGLQLHPWVNPPHREEVCPGNSFPGNLPPALERDKLTALSELVTRTFGAAPIIYRAGRYGAGPHTAALLAEAGIAVDSSVRAGFSYAAEGGPDYIGHPTTPYWVGPGQGVLELPLTTAFWGLLRNHGRRIYAATGRAEAVRGLLARTGLLERIALTPEGVDSREALRGVDIALDEGLDVLVLSFHSPSLVPGNTPYVHDEAGLDRLYDWWRTVCAYLLQRGVQPASVAEIVAAARAARHPSLATGAHPR